MLVRCSFTSQNGTKWCNAISGSCSTGSTYDSWPIGFCFGRLRNVRCTFHARRGLRRHPEVSPAGASNRESPGLRHHRWLFDQNSPRHQEVVCRRLSEEHPSQSRSIQFLCWLDHWRAEKIQRCWKALRARGGVSLLKKETKGGNIETKRQIVGWFVTQRHVFLFAGRCALNVF